MVHQRYGRAAAAFQRCIGIIQRRQHTSYDEYDDRTHHGAVTSVLAMSVKGARRTTSDTSDSVQSQMKSVTVRFPGGQDEKYTQLGVTFRRRRWTYQSRSRADRMSTTG